jgi:small-conductance mechanosensitive channel
LVLQKPHWQIDVIGKFHNITKYIITKIKPLLVILIALYVSTLELNLPQNISNILRNLFQAALILQIILILQEIVRLYFEYFSHKNYKKDTEIKALYGYLSRFIIIGIWIIGLLSYLANVGYDISSLIASLGIGGIAVALAVQGILKDIFSGFTILLNKPFQVGDLIKVGEKGDFGTVEGIGFKNTVIKLVGTESLVIPNSDILNSKIYNFQSRKKRRVSFKLFVDLATKASDVEKFKKDLIEVLNSQENIEKEPLRVVFSDYNEYSMILEIMYFMSDSNFESYVNTRDQVNFQIKKLTEKLKIKFSDLSPNS